LYGHNKPVSQSGAGDGRGIAKSFPGRGLSRDSGHRPAAARAWISLAGLLVYRSFGIENIWIIDPEPRLAYRYTSAGLEEVHTGELSVPETPIRVVLSEMFAELDQA
jgi:hypothetical protein